MTKDAEEAATVLMFVQGVEGMPAHPLSLCEVLSFLFVPEW